MSLQSLKEIFEALEPVIKVLGVPVAIFLYWKNKSREKRERDYATYDTLDDKYNDFVKLCFDNPGLGISQFASTPNNLTTEQIYQRERIFEMLFSNFERAYLMYQDKTNSIKIRQWNGWDANIKTWVKNDDFINAWKSQEAQWDTEFTEYMNSIIFSR